MDHWRQVDLVPPEALAFPITLIGVGGIGSAVALALAKMGCSQLTLHDADTVERHNLPNQLYRLQDVGRPKVEALRDVLLDYASPSVQAIPEAVAGQPLTGVVISGVDSMASRATVWRESVRFRAAVPLYLDARMGAQVCRLLTVHPTDPDDVRRYEATLFSDETASEEPCTAQAIIYTTFGMASLVANQIKHHAQAEPFARDILFDFATLSLLYAGEINGA